MILIERSFFDRRDASTQTALWQGIKRASLKLDVLVQRLSLACIYEHCRLLTYWLFTGLRLISHQPTAETWRIWRPRWDGTQVIIAISCSCCLCVTCERISLSLLLSSSSSTPQLPACHDSWHDNQVTKKKKMMMMNSLCKHYTYHAINTTMHCFLNCELITTWRQIHCCPCVVINQVNDSPPHTCHISAARRECGRHANLIATCQFHARDAVTRPAAPLHSQIQSTNRLTDDFEPATEILIYTVRLRSLVHVFKCEL